MFSKLSFSFLNFADIGLRLRAALLFIAAVVLLALTGCRSSTTPLVPTDGGPGSAAGKATPDGRAVSLTPLMVATTAVPTPTATPEPLALRVNGEPIILAEYQADLRQLQEARQKLGKQASPDQERQQVLDNMTELMLLAQGAEEAGFKLDDAGLQAEVDRLAQQAGGAEGLKKWVDARGYNDASFRAALRRSLAAAWQRDQLAAQVPSEAEQIHARQILTTDEDNAKRALERLQIPGTNFAAYAYQYDPLTGGDLGWFPRGYLAQPEVEAAVFSLQPGQYSEVIKSAIGYHIVQVIAREPSRALSPDARRVLQHAAIANWLKDRREKSQVEILLP